MSNNAVFDFFYEQQYHAKEGLPAVFANSVDDVTPLHVASFILSILHQGIFSVSAFIVSVIYLSRFKEVSHITLHTCTWRPLFLTTLLIADKTWEDKPVGGAPRARQREGGFFFETTHGTKKLVDLRRTIFECVCQPYTSCSSWN